MVIVMAEPPWNQPDTKKAEIEELMPGSQVKKTSQL